MFDGHFDLYPWVDQQPEAAFKGTPKYHPMHTTHTNDVEMADTSPELWCLIEGDTRPFSVTVSSSVSTSKLKRMIKQEKENNSRVKSIDALDLILWKVRYF